MKYCPLILSFLLLFIYFGFGVELISVKLIDEKLEFILKSHEKLTMVTFNGEPYPLELIEKRDDHFIYRVLIEVSRGDFTGGDLTFYTVNASKETLDIPSKILRDDEFKKVPVPAVLYVIGSKEFGNLVIQNIGNQFKKAEILDGWLLIFTLEKNAVLIFENGVFENFEAFKEFLKMISKTFKVSFILLVDARFEVPPMVPYDEIPKNVSFVILNTLNEDFFKKVPYVDHDKDGWIEASEIANVFNGKLFYDDQCVPFIRAAVYPKISDEELRMKLKNLAFEGILNIGDIEKCIKDFKEGISPPWLNEYLIGKLKLANLKAFKRLYSW